MIVVPGAAIAGGDEGDMSPQYSDRGTTYFMSPQKNSLKSLKRPLHSSTDADVDAVAASSQRPRGE